MVIVILGILAAVAIPQYFNLTDDANAAAEKGVVGGVRAGIQTYFAQNKAWPAALDSASAGACGTGAQSCFSDVLAQGGIMDDSWSADGSDGYTGPAGTTYTYDPATGAFSQ